MNWTGLARNAGRLVGGALGKTARAFSRPSSNTFIRNAAITSGMKKLMPEMKSAGIFKRAATAARHTFTAANFKNDISVRTASRIIKSKPAQLVGRGTKGLFYTAPRKIIRGVGKVGPVGLLSVGATAMMGVGIMNGMNNAAKDYVLERYMADQRFSRDILLQSRVGLSMGTNKMNRMGSTMGLSNALSKTRHGASY